MRFCGSVTTGGAKRYAVVLLFLAGSLCAERLPVVSGESLSGKQMSFPAAAAGSVAILCIGFSRSSQSQVKPWSERLNKEFHDEHLPFYAMPVLEDAPRMIRGMIIRGMKGSVPKQQHEHFVVIVQGESDLKRAASFKEADDAYILLLDANGNIQWRAHGPVSDAALQELARRARSLVQPK